MYFLESNKNDQLLNWITNPLACQIVSNSLSWAKPKEFLIELSSDRWKIWFLAHALDGAQRTECCSKRIPLFLPTFNVSQGLPALESMKQRMRIQLLPNLSHASPNMWVHWKKHKSTHLHLPHWHIHFKCNFTLPFHSISGFHLHIAFSLVGVSNLPLSPSLRIKVIAFTAQIMQDNIPISKSLV